MFRKAVTLDPGYALALTGLADCDSNFCFFYSSDRKFIAAALDNCKKALKLDPGLAEAHASMGLALSLNGEEAAAENEFRTAIDLDPTLYEAYWHFGFTKVMHGELEAAAGYFEQATKVRGDDLQSKMMLMGAFSGLGRQAEMLAAARETLKIAARRLELNPDDARAAYIGAHALIHLNDKARAREWADIAAGIDSSDPRTTYNLACAYSLLGEINKALDFLELSIKAGRPLRMRDWARIDPDLQAARENPRFEALMKRWRDE
jgi:adenylate cyclase